jgi:hypothetical protein
MVMARPRNALELPYLSTEVGFLKANTAQAILLVLVAEISNNRVWRAP